MRLHERLLGLTALFLSWASGSYAALPAGFTEQNLTRPDGAAWSEAVGMAFTASGRLFVWERGGSVWIIDPAARTTARFLDLRSEVAGYRDHGMLGFTLHPDYDHTGYVYALYVVERHHLVNCDSPREGAPVCGPNYIAGTHTPFTPTVGRIVRYRAVLPAGDTTYARATQIDPSSRQVLVGESYWFSDPNRLDPAKPRNTACPILHESHGVGSLVFGQDGTLLASCGDGASYSLTDLGPNGDTYFAQALTEGIILPKENVGAYRAQMVDSFSGKVIRIDPDSGDGISSNPFFDAAKPRSARSRVWALGLRNPYRFTLRPFSGSHNPLAGNPGVFYLGDVGWTTWEDLNLLRVGGQNFGWPAFEGQGSVSSYYNANVENLDAPNPLYNGTTCTRQYFYFRELIKQDTLSAPSWPNPCNAAQQITTADVFLHARPALDWRHGQNSSRFAAFNGVNAVAQPIGTVAPDGTTVAGTAFAGNTSTGGVWYTGTQFPAMYRNTYFHADYGAVWIKNFVFDDANVLKEVRSFGDNVGGVVALAMHPVNGDLYYIAWSAFVRRISYTPTQNVPPVAVAKVDKPFGASPLTVVFNANESTDPNGTALTYTWDFGDGSAPGTGATPSHTYTAAGITNFNATLTAHDPGGLTAPSTVLISVNNTPPTAQITSPVDGSLYSMAGATTYPLTATLADAQTGAATLSCSWLTVLHHNNHTHQDPPLTACSGTTVITPVGCDGQTYFFEVKLTVSDPQGLTTQKSAFVYPNCPGADTVPPSVPAGLSASAVSGSQINLSWTASTDNAAVTGYQVERCQGAGCVSFAPLTTVTGTTYSNVGVAGSTSYSYRVRATDAASNLSGYSNVASATTQTTQPPATVIRVNVGGPAYTDSAGNVWSADTGFNTGNALAWPANTAIAGTSDPALYRTERWDDVPAPELQYSFNVPNGTYQAKLHFAENYAPLFNVGQRVFDVRVENVLAIDNLDIFAQAGARTALIKTLTATVSDGQLNIQLVHQTEDPEINAIEIVSQATALDTVPPGATTGLTATATSASQVNLAWTAATDNIGVTGYQVERCQGAGCSNFALVTTVAGTSLSNTGLAGSTSYSYRVRARDAANNLGAYSAVASTTTPVAPATVIRVNVGGPAYTDTAGNVWSADTGFNTGNALSWPASTAIAGTSDPTLYRTERWDDVPAPELQYSFNVPNGTYQVRLHFAENYAPLFSVGQRVFDVRVEGGLAIDNLDIFAQAGARAALVKTVMATVTDGQLNIQLVHQTEDPELNAIEIVSQ